MIELKKKNQVKKKFLLQFWIVPHGLNPLSVHLVLFARFPPMPPLVPPMDHGMASPCGKKTDHREKQIKISAKVPQKSAVGPAPVNKTSLENGPQIASHPAICDSGPPAAKKDLEQKRKELTCRKKLNYKSKKEEQWTNLSPLKMHMLKEIQAHMDRRIITHL